jgi:NAD(P)-dependent dehydrogenase (short-subunit alcohol dehydrogenase family)
MGALAKVPVGLSPFHDDGCAANCTPESSAIFQFTWPKAAMLSFSRLVADVYANYGIRCNAVTPGPTATEGAGAALWPTPEEEGRVASSVPIGRLARVEEIAWWTTALCAPRAAYITGANLTIDGGHWLEQEGYMGALGR